MYKIVGLLIFSLIAPLLAEEDDWSLNSNFSLWGQFVYMDRSNTHKSDFVQAIIKETSTLFHLKEENQRFKYEPGFRVGASYITKKSLWEASYMHLHEWEKIYKKNDEGLFYIDTKASYKTGLDDGEFNYFHYFIPPRESYLTLCVLGGFRYSFLKENFAILFLEKENALGYKSGIKNNIYGLQTGLGLQVNVTRRFFWDFIAKIGVGYDEICRKTVLLGEYHDKTKVKNYVRTSSNFPLILNGRLKIAYLLDDWIDMHVGYELIYFNGIALIPNQSVKKEITKHTIQTNGEVIFYGLFAGLSFNF